MSLRGEPGSIAYRPPQLAAAAADRSPHFFVFTAGAAGAQQDTGIGANGGRWVTLQTTQDCYIGFGANGMGLPTTSDMPLLAAEGKVSFFCESGDRYFRVFGGPTGGTVYWYLSDSGPEAGS